MRRKLWMNRMNIVGLGVRDMARSIKFYRDDLGFKTDEKGYNPEIIFFNTTGTKLSLYPLELLAEDINRDNPPEIAKGFSGMTLAYNVKSKEEVGNIIELVRKAGAKIVKEPQDVSWGGYHAYFTDPDGYYWEVSWGPDFAFDEEGMLKL